MLRDALPLPGDDHTSLRAGAGMRLNARVMA
jgi:hypothetical protein